MEIYLLVILGIGLISALAKTAGWRPKPDPNWHHFIDGILIAIGFFWILFSRILS